MYYDPRNDLIREPNFAEVKKEREQRKENIIRRIKEIKGECFTQISIDHLEKP